MKPILFNTEMVRAILDGRKTVTRRVVKPQPKYAAMTAAGLITSENPITIEDGLVVTKNGDITTWGKLPYHPGDILYVRETWCDPSGTGYPFLYKADMPMHWDAENTEIGVPIDLKDEDYTWRPSIHMPKEAARLFLRVKAVRVGRLRAMGMEDALKEGVIPTNRPGGCRCRFSFDGCMEEPCPNRSAYEIERHLDPFIQLWNGTMKPTDLETYGWAANPWVWVIEFERITKEVKL